MERFSLIINKQTPGWVLECPGCTHQYSVLRAPAAGVDALPVIGLLISSWEAFSARRTDEG